MRGNNPVTAKLFNKDEAKVLTLSGDGTARLCDLQPDHHFKIKHLARKLEVQTGTKIDDVGEIEFLSIAEWWKKKGALEKIIKESDFRNPEATVVSIDK